MRLTTIEEEDGVHFEKVLHENFLDLVELGAVRLLDLAEEQIFIKTLDQVLLRIFFVLCFQDARFDRLCYCNFIIFLDLIISKDINIFVLFCLFIDLLLNRTHMVFSRTLMLFSRTQMLFRWLIFLITIATPLCEELIMFVLILFDTSLKLDGIFLFFFFVGIVSDLN